MSALVGFDVDRIQESVFAGSRPLDILGSSAIIEQFAQTACQIAEQEHGATPIYAGGGAGMFTVPGDLEDAEALAARFEAELARVTGGAATCSAAAVDGGGEFRDDQARLGAAIAARKRTRWLEEPGRILAEVRDPRALCQACGLEPATTTDRLGGDDEEHIGDQCQLRRKAGRAAREQRQAGFTPAQDLDDLFDGDGSGDGGDRPPSRWLAAVYLDVDKAGEKVATCADRSELKELASRLRDGTRTALAAAIDATGLDGRVIAPVVGGDDVLVLANAAVAGRLLAAVWDGIDRYITTPLGLYASAGVAVTHRYLPLRLVTRHAATALRRAKEASYESDEAHVTVTAVGRIRRSAPDAGPVFGGPLPRSCLTAGNGSDTLGGSLGALLAALHDVPPAQRSGLLADLSRTPASLRELDVDYRIAHRSLPSLARAVETARSIAETANANRVGGGGTDPWKVLAGGLFLLDLGWTP